MMTLVNFGQLTPIQGDMLFLAGYVALRNDGSRDLVRQEDDRVTVESIRQGAAALRRATGQDFGPSLADWHLFLINDAQLRKSYTRSLTWNMVRRAILKAMASPDRARLEALANSM